MIWLENHLVVPGRALASLVALVALSACGDAGPGTTGASASSDPSGASGSTSTAETSASGTSAAATTPGSTGDPTGATTAVTTSDPSAGTEPATTTSDTEETTEPGLPPVALEGYGTTSGFGEGGELCTVTTLEDGGPGSLRDCVESRDTQDDNPTPRRIEFAVGGTIVQLSDLRIRQPYLTIDGLSAPAPGVTIEKLGDGTAGQTIINTWPPNATCGHDVLVQGIRFRGVWTGASEDHNQNAATIAIDGEDLPTCLHHVVLNRVTVLAAQDSGGDIWGSARDITVQYSAFLNSLHPNTYSHWPGGEADQQRERLSHHHNLYYRNHERNPQVRGNVWDANFEQNISHRWDGWGFPGGYGMRLRCRNDACPQRVNVIENHWAGGSDSPDAALILGDAVGPEDDGPIADQTYMSGNHLPAENVDVGAAAAEFPRAPEAAVTLYGDDELVTKVLPNIGVPFRTPEEDAIFDEVAAQLVADSP